MADRRLGPMVTALPGTTAQLLARIARDTNTTPTGRNRAAVLEAIRRAARSDKGQLELVGRLIHAFASAYMRKRFAEVRRGAGRTPRSADPAIVRLVLRHPRRAVVLGAMESPGAAARATKRKTQSAPAKAPTPTAPSAWAEAGVTPSALQRAFSAARLSKVAMRNLAQELGLPLVRAKTTRGLIAAIMRTLSPQDFLPTWRKHVELNAGGNTSKQLRGLAALGEIPGGLFPASCLDVRVPARIAQSLELFLAAAKRNFGVPAGRLRAISEDDVELSFVELLLRALGWRVAVIDEVSRKRGSRAGQSDYEVWLYGQPQLVIEVKRPTIGVDGAAREQALRYAKPLRIDWVITTNGLVLELYHRLLPTVPAMRFDFAGSNWSLSELDRRRLCLLGRNGFEHSHLQRAWYEANRALLPGR